MSQSCSAEFWEKSDPGWNDLNYKLYRLSVYIEIYSFPLVSCHVHPVSSVCSSPVWSVTAQCRSTRLLSDRPWQPYGKSDFSLLHIRKTNRRCYVSTYIPTFLSIACYRLVQNPRILLNAALCKFDNAEFAVQSAESLGGCVTRRKCLRRKTISVFISILQKSINIIKFISGLCSLGKPMHCSIMNATIQILQMSQYK